MKRPKFVYHVPAYNDFEWLVPNIETMVRIFDLVVVSEGSCVNYRKPLRSTDGTDQWLHAATSRFRNLKVVRAGKIWSKSEQRESVIQFLSPGDYLMVSGADEFYQPRDLERVMSFASRHPHIHQFDPVMLNFWKDGRTLAGNYLGPPHPSQQRFWRWFPGMSFSGFAETLSGNRHRILVADWIQYHYMIQRKHATESFHKHLYYNRQRNPFGVAVAKALHVTAFSRHWHTENHGVLPRANFTGQHPPQVAKHELVNFAHWQNERDRAKFPDWKSVFPGCAMDPHEAAAWAKKKHVPCIPGIRGKTKPWNGGSYLYLSLGKIVGLSHL